MRTTPIRCFFSLAVLAIVGLFYACEQDAFQIHESGLQYQILRSNNNTPTAEMGDVLALRYRIISADNEVVEESVLFKIRLTEPSHAGGAIEDGLSLLHKGDSAVFIINAKDYFYETRNIDIPSGIDTLDNIEFHVTLIDIISKEAFLQDEEAAQMAGERSEEYELRKYIANKGIQTEPELSGLYIIPLNEGDGTYPQPNKKVKVHYIASFLNGQVFDSSYERDEPFVFPLAIGQVIPGWDEGVSKMKIGGKYQLIIPSYLAYGSEQVGPIPPYSTLIFDIELIEVVN